MACSRLVPSADSSNLIIPPRNCPALPVPQMALLCRSLQTREKITNHHCLGLPRSPLQSYGTSGATKRDQTRQELVPKHMESSHQMRMLLILLIPISSPQTLLSHPLLPSLTVQSLTCSHTSLLSSCPVKINPFVSSNCGTNPVCVR